MLLYPDKITWGPLPCWWIFKFCNTQIIPRVYVRLLASQEEICSTKFVRKKWSTNTISIACFSGRLTGSVGNGSVTVQLLQRKTNQHGGPTWNKRKRVCELIHSPLRCQRQPPWWLVTFHPEKVTGAEYVATAKSRTRRWEVWLRAELAHIAYIPIPKVANATNLVQLMLHLIGANETKIQKWYLVYLTAQRPKPVLSLHSHKMDPHSFVNGIGPIRNGEAGTLTLAFGLGVSQVHSYSI
jgi:hypothetical protein